MKKQLLIIIQLNMKLNMFLEKPMKLIPNKYQSKELEKLLIMSQLKDNFIDHHKFNMFNNQFNMHINNQSNTHINNQSNIHINNTHINNQSNICSHLFSHELFTLNQDHLFNIHLLQCFNHLPNKKNDHYIYILYNIKIEHI